VFGRSCTGTPANSVGVFDCSILEKSLAATLTTSKFQFGGEGLQMAAHCSFTNIQTACRKDPSLRADKHVIRPAKLLVHVNEKMGNYAMRRI
jgi:hypothetical protein